MENSIRFDFSPKIRARHLTLHPVTIEKTFTDCVMDLWEVIVLDSIDILPDNSGFRVSSHDLRGALPEIVVKDSDNTFQDRWKSKLKNHIDG